METNRVEYTINRETNLKSDDLYSVNLIWTLKCILLQLETPHYRATGVLAVHALDFRL